MLASAVHQVHAGGPDAPAQSPAFRCRRGLAGAGRRALYVVVDLSYGTHFQQMRNLGQQ
jgi:hypothetical protein